MILTFREFINEQFVTEAFDTTHKIIKTEKGNPDFYYIDIGENKFRIFIEKAQDSKTDLHIGFEYLNGNNWEIRGIHNILKAKEILGLFGTILVILKKYEMTSLMFCTKETKKFRTYLRMMERLVQELNIKNLQHNDECIFGFNIEYKPKFNYKREIK